MLEPYDMNRNDFTHWEWFAFLRYLLAKSTGRPLCLRRQGGIMVTKHEGHPSIGSFANARRAPSNSMGLLCLLHRSSGYSGGCSATLLSVQVTSLVELAIFVHFCIINWTNSLSNPISD